MQAQAVYPTLALGTASWGWNVDRPTAFALLDQFYGAGFRQVDGATNYPINKRPEDFRLAETILLEWIAAQGVQDLQLCMKVGSLDNLRSPDHNLAKSFLLMMLDEYRQRFGPNLDTLMIHWDNRAELAAIRESLEALDYARQLGLHIGLSGIRHPELYAQLNEEFQFDFRIQIKHNVLHSDYGRYAAFHGQRGFVAYGINAGGLKLRAEAYHENSSLRVRGGDTRQEHPLAPRLREIIAHANENTARLPVADFNHCGMAFAFHSPDLAAILLGPSRPQQLDNSLAFYRHLQTGAYADLYQSLKELHENQP
jgi:aryl-alcohol dehydrogenase-like predicted oxidoreductase